MMSQRPDIDVPRPEAESGSSQQLLPEGTSGEAEVQQFQRNQRLQTQVHWVLILGIWVVFGVIASAVIVYAIHLLSPVGWLDDVDLSKLESGALGLAVATFTMLVRRVVDR